VTAEEFVEELGRLYAATGRSRLEGRLAALLLTRSEPMSLTQAAKELGTAKSALSKLVNEMLKRGDLVREGRFSTREHLYSLVDHSYIRDLRERAEVSRRIAELSSALARDPTISSTQVVQRLTTHAGIHGQAALVLSQVLAPEERLHRRELQRHEEENWDAIPPREETKAEDSLGD
jgi:DNA-binding transcriptional regulator GbsR (MarR family)